MSSEAKEINTALKLVRDIIRSLPVGRNRDILQARFELTLDRIEQIPARVMLQYDAGTVANNGEFDDIRRTELLWALSAMEGG